MATATHHLKNITAKEVAFVGRGANGKGGEGQRWLLAKAADATEQAPAPVAPVAEPAPVAAAEPAPAQPAAPVVKDEGACACGGPGGAECTCGGTEGCECGCMAKQKAAPVEPPAAPVVSEPAVSVPAPDLEKAAKARADMQRKVWALIHREIDAILSGDVAEPTESVADAAPTVEAAKQAPVAAPVVPLLPPEVTKALEQLPVLVAKVQAQEAEIAKLSSERVGSRALAVDGAALEPVAKAADEWTRVTDLNELIAREKQQARR